MSRMYKVMSSNFFYDSTFFYNTMLSKGLECLIKTPPEFFLLNHVMSIITKFQVPTLYMVIAARLELAEVW